MYTVEDVARGGRPGLHYQRALATAGTKALCVVWTDKAECVVSGAADGTAHVWEATTGRHLLRITVGGGGLRTPGAELCVWAMLVRLLCSCSTLLSAHTPARALCVYAWGMTVKALRRRSELSVIAPVVRTESVLSECAKSRFVHAAAEGGGVGLCLAGASLWHAGVWRLGGARAILGRRARDTAVWVSAARGGRAGAGGHACG